MELNDNFWNWFEDSVTIDKDGNPLIFYHGTRRKFDTFKAKYGDGLIFFAYDENFAKEWAESDTRLTSDEINNRDEKVRPFKNALFKKNTKKQGSDEWYLNMNKTDTYKRFKQTTDKYKNRVERQMGIDVKVMPVYIKAKKIFIPERDYELILDKIFEYYDWDLNIDTKIKEATDSFNKANDELNNYRLKNPDNRDEEYQKYSSELDRTFRCLNDLTNQKSQIEHDLNRIKKGSWIYFEHKVVIDKIWELGFDAIQLSEKEGIPTTLAVREGTNQIKSVDNNGDWSTTSNNIYECSIKELNELLENYINE